MNVSYVNFPVVLISGVGELGYFRNFRLENAIFRNISKKPEI